MDVNRDEICKSLLDWFNVLTADDTLLKPTQRTELNDGVAIARALHKLGPEFFTGKICSRRSQTMNKARGIYFRRLAV